MQILCYYSIPGARQYSIHRVVHKNMAIFHVKSAALNDFNDFFNKETHPLSQRPITACYFGHVISGNQRRQELAPSWHDTRSIFRRHLSGARNRSRFLDNVSWTLGTTSTLTNSVGCRIG